MRSVTKKLVSRTKTLRAPKNMPRPTQKRKRRMVAGMTARICGPGIVP